MPPAIAWIGAFPGGHNRAFLRFRSMAFQRLTVYSRRNALSLRAGVCSKKLHALKTTSHPCTKSLPCKGRWPGGAGTERFYQICSNLSVSLRLTAPLGGEPLTRCGGVTPQALRASSP